MNSGFYINRLVSKGIDCEDAAIEFSSNAHVIIGPSNTGKTYVFQCLKYMLGSTKKPKKIKESSGYESCYLEIVLPDGSKHTLYRDLSGGDAFLYECPYEEVSNYSKDAEMLIVG